MAEIRISNKMSTMYDLVGQDDVSFDVEVTVGVYVDDSVNTDVTVRASRNSDIPVKVDVVYSEDSEIEIDVHPIIQSDIAVEVEVNPTNRMTARFEILEPSTVKYELPIIKDTFVSSTSPFNVVNFGSNNSMKVGNDSYGNNITYLGFDISDLPLNKIIKSAKMRVYYTNYNGFDLQLNNVKDSWSEYGLTYNNSGELTPIPTSFEINSEERYIEFDVLDIFNDWYRGIPNNGIAITSEDFLTLFKARETGQAPVLIVEHYSDEIYNLRNYNIFTEVLVSVMKDSEIPVDVNVISLYSNDEILVELLAHQKDEVINSDIPVTVEVVEYDDYSDIETDVTVVLNDSSQFDVELTVPQYEDNSDITTDVTVTLNDSSEIELEVSVPIKEDESNIDIDVTARNMQLNSSDINVEVITVNNDDSNIDVEFEISDKVLIDDDSEIGISVEVIEKDEFSEIPIEVSVYGYENDEILVDIGVLAYDNDEIYVEIAIPNADDDSIDVEVKARVLDVSNVSVELTVVSSKKSIYCYLI